jgi:hypothetical protein
VRAGSSHLRGVGDALSELLPEGCPCCMNHADGLGLSENWKIGLTTVITELVAWPTRLVWIHR